MIAVYVGNVFFILASIPLIIHNHATMPKMKTVLELFFITPGKACFQYVRRELDITLEARDPDLLVNEYCKYFLAEGRIIKAEGYYFSHSTSWRYEQRQSIMLTYCIFANHLEFVSISPETLLLSDISITHSQNPQKPRPEMIPMTAVVSHALRHLAFLLQEREGQLEKVLDKKSRDLLLQLPPLLAGRLTN